MSRFAWKPVFWVRNAGRALRIALVLFGLAVASLAAAAWLAGDRSHLEMEYEGFD